MSQLCPFNTFGIFFKFLNRLTLNPNFWYMYTIYDRPICLIINAICCIHYLQSYALFLICIKHIMGGLFFKNNNCRGLDTYLMNRPQKLADPYFFFSVCSRTYRIMPVILDKIQENLFPKFWKKMFKLGCSYLAYCCKLECRSLGLLLGKFRKND